MTTIDLDLDNETKKFERMDGPALVHAGETVRLVLHGLPEDIVIDPNEQDVQIDESPTDPEQDESLYPPLRVRLVHELFGDLAVYPWPGSPAQWSSDETNGTVSCDLSLDTEQLFRVVRSGQARSLLLYVERPWPQESPTVYGTYAIRVEDWPEATGEARELPSGLRYLSALEALNSLGQLPESATLADAIRYVNALVGALKNYRRASTDG